jgi:uncharacterized protein YndB with AHSA1/START domain
MNNAATMRVTSDQDELVSEIHIAAPSERVFQALIDPQQVVQWWGQASMYRCTEFSADLRPEAGGAARGWEDRTASFRSLARLWKSIRRIRWFIPGWPVGQAT